MALDTESSEGLIIVDDAYVGLASKLGRAARACLMPLASLKLTVALFGLAIFLVFASTLAQKQVDVWDVIYHWYRIDERDLINSEPPYFHVSQLFVRIPLQVFCIDLLWPSFLGEPPTTNLGLWFPRGWLIGLLMGINLVAAHSVRFTVQTRGVRLAVGLGVLALGGLATYAAIESGSSAGGILSGALLGWETLWKLLLVALAAVSFISLVAVFQLAPSRRTERATLGIVAAACAAAVGFGLYYTCVHEKAFIGPESMRILWQLLKGAGAGLVLLAGCILVFKKRAGIVLLHGGIGLMFFYEVVVGTSHRESHMQIAQGESANWMQDIRSVELAIVVPGEKEDRVTIVPQRDLKVDQTVKLPDAATDVQDKLPFDVKIVEWFDNSALRRKGPVEPTPATTGAGLRNAVVRVPKTVGASGDSSANYPSAFVEVVDKKDGKSLGTLLLSAHLAEPQRIGEVDGKPYEISLRFVRTFTPFTIEAKEVRADHYVASSRPKNYSSLVRVVDPANKIDREELIKMNSPMRFAGLTFYQSNYAEDEHGHPITTFQVVHNVGWMLPYVGCMIVGVGMLAQFGGVLLRFLARRRPAASGDVVRYAGREAPTSRTVSDVTTAAKSSKRPKRREAAKVAERDAEDEAPASGWPVWVLPLVVVAVIGAFLAYTAKPMKPDERGMDLGTFAKLPIAADARVKPYDALARSSLAYFSHKQTFKLNPDDKNEPSKPAIRWLLDVMTNNPAADDYKVFRIENDELVSVLGMQPERSLCYSHKQIFAKKHPDPDADSGARERSEFEYQMALAREKHSEGKTGPFERELGELTERIDSYDVLKFAFSDPKAMWHVNLNQLVVRPEIVQQQITAASQELLQMMDRLAQVPKMTRKPAMAVPVAGPEWETMLDSNLRHYIADPSRKVEVDRLYEGLLTAHERLAEVFQDKTLDQSVRLKIVRLAMGIEKFHELVDAQRTGKAKQVPAEAKVLSVFDAYRSGDGVKFNAAVADYSDYLAQNPPSEYDRTRRNLEAFLLRSEPFFWCSWIYLLGAIVACASWLGFSRPLNRAAWWVVTVTFAMHASALILRMFVTERPPVVNLYSSAVFIGVAAVLIGVIFEQFFKNGVGTVVAAVSGFGSLYIAHLLSRQGDTIEALQAVLDTQFWLSTHVTSITLGYAATFVAGVLGMVYVFLGVTTPTLSRDVAKDITRMIYGVLCFALFLSFIGTVLGGLWADDSWGRFWGWDPKENGALIIVLWNALVLHARWDGMIKERGLAVLAVAGNITTSWSWFGVNQLGVGLHAYGFSKELRLFLMLFVVSSLVTILLGLLPKNLWLSRDRLKSA